jgi:HSP20 family protein
MVYKEVFSSYHRLSPPSEFDAFSAHLEGIWAQLLRGRPQQPQYSPGGIRPAVDVYETPEAVFVVLEAPGMRDRELRLELESGRLTIWGEKRNRHCGDTQVYNQVEIACGPFSRTVDLPSPIDPDRISLRYEDGYVEIRLPRVQRRMERRVRITLHQP